MAHEELIARANAQLEAVIKRGEPKNENPALVIAAMIHNAFPGIEINWDFVAKMEKLCEEEA